MKIGSATKQQAAKARAKAKTIAEDAKRSKQRPRQHSEEQRKHRQRLIPVKSIEIRGFEYDEKQRETLSSLEEKSRTAKTDVEKKNAMLQGIAIRRAEAERIVLGSVQP